MDTTFPKERFLGDQHSKVYNLGRNMQGYNSVIVPSLWYK